MLIGKKHLEIFKGSGITLLGTLAGYVLNYFFKFISGRYLGPSGFGILAIGISIMTIFANLSVVGLNEGITRFIPYYKARKDFGRIKSMLLFGKQVSLAVGCIITLIIFFNARWISENILHNTETEMMIKIFSLFIPIQTFFIFTTGVMRGLKKIAAIAVAKNILMWVVKILFALAIFLLGLSVEYFALGFLSALLISSIYYLKKLGKEKFYIKLKAITPAKKTKKEMITYSLPLTLTSLFRLLRDRTDILIIGAFLPSADVGLYYAALPFAMILTVVLFSINHIINPVISETLGEGDTRTTKKIFKDFAVLSFQVTLPMFLFIFFFAEKIIVFVYGNAFIDAAVLLRILSVGYFLNAITGSFGEFLRAFNKTKFVFYISGLGGISNVLLMFWLIPRQGVVGASIAALSSQLLIVLLGVCFNQWLLGINPFNLKYLKTALIGTIYFALLFFFEKCLSPWAFLFIFAGLSIIYVFLQVYFVKIVNCRLGVIK